jgi:hypothetical protein
VAAEEIERDAAVDLPRRLARSDLKIREIDLPHAPPCSLSLLFAGRTIWSR